MGVHIRLYKTVNDAGDTLDLFRRSVPALAIRRSSGR
jgi:hypothetical protein